MAWRRLISGPDSEQIVSIRPVLGVKYPLFNTRESILLQIPPCEGFGTMLGMGASEGYVLIGRSTWSRVKA
jgi:hypothetical protein